jgi:hypothetical protein
VGSGEFKVIRSALAAKHDAIKAGMVLETEEEVEAKAIPIEGNQCIEVVGWASNTELGN